MTGSLFKLCHFIALLSLEDLVRMHVLFKNLDV